MNWLAELYRAEHNTFVPEKRTKKFGYIGDPNVTPEQYMEIPYLNISAPQEGMQYPMPSIRQLYNYLGGISL